MNNFIIKNIAKNITEYKHPEYETKIKEFKIFYINSQFDTIPDRIEFEKFSSKFSFEPRCGIGNRLFGWHEDGKLELLLETIDSSD